MEQITGKKSAFRYLADAVVTAISPAQFQRERLRLLISGANFFDSLFLNCRFGIDGPIIQARWLSANLLLCISPEGTWSPAGTSIPLFVTNNGVDYMSTPNVTLTVVSRIATFALEPSHGSIAGGTEISIYSYGVPFSGTAYCRFDRKIQVSATFDALNGIVQCITPAHAAGNSTVEISHDGVHFVMINDMFTYAAIRRYLRWFL